MKKLLLIVGAILLFACSEEKKEEVPDYVLAEDRFVDILTEFQLAESLVRLGYHRHPDSMFLNDSVYMGVFRSMGITQEVFDSNYSYYSKDPDKFGEMYDQVIENLSKRSAQLVEKKEAIEVDSSAN